MPTANHAAAASGAATSSSTATSTPTTSPTSSSTPTSSPTSSSSSFSSSSSSTSISTSITTLPTSTSTSRITHITSLSSSIQDTTVIHTITRHGTTSVQTSTSSYSPPFSSTSSTSSSSAVITHPITNNNKGLSSAGVTAIAVVIPVAVIALLIGVGIVFWRRRKQKKEDEDLRRKEVEEYNYNPNGDPTLPAIGSDAGGAQMTEDHSSGYRGWGATAASRKMSTTLSGGHTQQLSDSGNSYGQHGSDPNGMADRDTMGSDDLAALPAMAGGAAAGRHANNLRRGPSNASSAYSAGERDDSEERPPMPIGQAYDYTPSNTYGYGQHGPYGDASYGGGAGTQQPTSNGMPVVRDLNARRDTRIQPGGSYQQGNSGIAQNF